MNYLIAKSKYNWQKNSAQKRGISWELSFEQWYNWWLSNGVDKNIDTSLMTSAKLCMCRQNDSGPYSLSNIYCDTNSNNVRLQNTLRWGQRQLHTPLGIFNSRQIAAQKLNVTPKYLSILIKRKPKEYYWL